MPFSSLLFIHLFLPLFLIAYWMAPRGAKNGVAIAGSLLFYAWGAPRFLPVVLGLGLIDFYLARTIARRAVEARADHRLDQRRVAKLLLGLGVTMHLSILAYFKYSNFFVGEINSALSALGMQPFAWTHVVLPIGVSFITFEEITYLCDVYRGDAKPAKRFSHYLLFLTLFPHSIAGPIFRWKDLERQLAERIHTVKMVCTGFERFSLGLAKKVLVADSVAIIADGIFALPGEQLTTGLAWLGALAYTIQIYFDFSGYSDMAIGLGLMIGFRFKENFDKPYRAASFTEFWTRWHISLSSWLRDYLYIPLGGNRRGPRRALVNLMIVFLLSGLWHGAAWTFILWGAFHGTLVTLERLAGERRARVPRWIQHGTTLPLIVVSWVFFRATSTDQVWLFLSAMFGFDAVSPLVPPPIRGYFLPNFAVAALIFGGITSLAPNLALRSWLRIGYFLLFALSAMHLTNMRITPLIYFKF